MGGGFALLTVHSFDTVSANYGFLPKDVDKAMAGACPVVASYGALDQPLRAAPARLEAALTKAGVAHDVKQYPKAGHAFLNETESGPGWLRPLLRTMHSGPEPESADRTAGTGSRPSSPSTSCKREPLEELRQHRRERRGRHLVETARQPDDLPVRHEATGSPWSAKTSRAPRSDPVRPGFDAGLTMSERRTRDVGKACSGLLGAGAALRRRFGCRLRLRGCLRLLVRRHHVRRDSASSREAESVLVRPRADQTGLLGGA